MIMTPGKYQGLRRIADLDGNFKMLAVDQRPPIEKLVSTSLTSETADPSDVTTVKESLIRGLAGHSSAVLMDPQYVFPQGLKLVPRDVGVLVTLEYDKFETTTGGRLSSAIPDWSVDKIKASGGDAVKVLAWYRPDAAPAVIDHQMEFVSSIGHDCQRLDIPYVFELLLYPLPSEDGHTLDYVESPTKRTDHVIESVETFAAKEFAVDLFKLESPVATGDLDSSTAGDAFRQMGKAAERPWVMLSAGANPVSFRTMLELAYDAGASGYLAGRAIWWDECKTTYPDVVAMERTLADTSVRFMKEINELTASRATPWTEHPIFGTEGPELALAGAEFRQTYRIDP